jgi:hypothetical protein
MWSFAMHSSGCACAKNELEVPENDADCFDLDAFLWSIFAAMNFDISHLLDAWDYQAGQIVVRKFKGKDGKEKIQLRVDLGILQMNVVGRPDGKQPYGHESLLEHFESRLEKYRAEHDNEEGFRLTAEDCAKLQQEAIQYHHRYICLFQLKEFDAVLRDTQRNVKVFDFVERFAEHPELAWALQQLRPQLLMMQIRALGSKKLDEGDFEGAIISVEDGLEEIRSFYREHGRADLIEQSGEIHSLEGWIQELRSTKPLSEKEKLEHALQDAVRREDYEKAAAVRDALRSLEKS